MSHIRRIARPLWTVAAVLALGLGSTSEARAQTVQQLRVQWVANAGAPPPPIQADKAQASSLFTVLERRLIAGALARQRDPQLSSTQLVLRAVNSRGEIIDTQLLHDPRILRAETPEPTGDLTGQVFHLSAPEFLLTIPDDPTITEIQVYQPRWTGRAYLLDLLGTIALN